MANEFRVKNGLAAGETTVINATGNWVGPAIPNNKLVNDFVTINGQTVELGSSITTSINTLSNVDVTAVTDGSVLVYAANTSKWTATIDLNKQNLDGGEF